MGLIIRQLKGDDASPPHEVGDDKERITFGRDPERCDVLFPADATTVGREHFALERDLGRYRLVLREDHLVNVDGEPGSDGAFIPEQCKIQLGPDGPEVLLRTTESADLPQTIAQGHRAGTATQLREVRASSKRGRIYGVLALALLVVAAGLGYRALRRTEQKAETASFSLSQTLSDLSGMRGELHEVRDDLVEVRTTAENVPTVDPDRLEKVERALAERGNELRNALTNARSSVYLVLVRTPDGDERGFGTAWVVAPGKLATNAHVAEEIAKFDEGVEMLVRSTTPPHDTFVVRSAELHPAYKAFRALWQSYVPVRGVDAESARMISGAGSGYDVGLLEVSDPDGKLGDPLPLATPEELDALGSATAVGYVGFPMENVSLGGTPLVEPTPQTQMGIVTAVTDYFGSASSSSSEPSDRHLLQHNCPATGGASGSPLIDSSGKVVAVLSGGNVFRLFDTRMPSAVGVNYGQRADLLHELLEARADAKQDDRIELWRRRLDQLFDSGYLQMRDSTAEAAIEAATILVESNSNLMHTIEWTELTDRSVTAPPAAKQEHAEVTWNVPEDGEYLILAIAERAAPFEAVALYVDPQVQPLALPFEPFDPGIHAMMFTAKRGWEITIGAASGDELPLGIRFEIHRGNKERMPPDTLRERLLANWLSHIGTGLRPEISASGEGELQPGREWRGTANARPPGLYMAIAVAPGGEDIDLFATRMPGQTDLGSDSRTDHFPVVTFELTEEADVELRVTGPREGVAFQLHLFQAVNPN